MRSIKNKDAGFSVVAGVLIIIVVAVASLAALTFINKHNNTAPVKSAIKPSQRQPRTQQSNGPVDTTSSWTVYTNTNGGFSLKHPNNWIITAGQGCPNGLALLAVNSATQVNCSGNDFGQMAISWRPKRANCGYTSAYWTTTSTDSITISGIRAFKTAATAKSGTSVPVGTKSEQYCLTEGDITYIASYSQLSNYPDVLADFDLMMTKTFILQQ